MPHAPTPSNGRAQDLERIRIALAAAVEALRRLGSGVWVAHKAGGDPVTAADEAVNEVLRRVLPREEEGWLSEDMADDLSRLERRRVWIVDPLDGTREFVAGIPEWCVSIGLVEDGKPVAGGICNPTTGEVFVGASGLGVTLNGRPVRMRQLHTLEGCEVLASRSEVGRGEWQAAHAPFRVRPMGSVAYKMALVAAGLADATWTLTPKNEWDVAAGAALLRAAGGIVATLAWQEPTFNGRDPKLGGLIAVPPGLASPLRHYLGRRLPEVA